MWYVDIPTQDCIDNEDGAWSAIANFETKAEAVAFVKKHFGADDNGNISLISGGD